jgi:phage terminase large subunit
MKNANRRFIFGYGGSSSAKSYSFAQAILIFCSLIEGSDTLVFRKVSANIEKSIYKDFKTIATNLNLLHYFEFQKLKIKCYNGAVIDFSGIDDPEKIKGIANYKRVLLEELSEFDFADFKQVRKRLRGMKGQQILGAFNPIDVDHWIKNNVFDKQDQTALPIYLTDNETKSIGFEKLRFDGSQYTSITEKWEGAPVEVDGVTYPPNFVVMKSTYKNNFWVSGSPCGEFGFYDVQTIADFENDKLEDFDFYNIYALGNWGKLNRGGEFYKKFKTDRHVKPAKYDPEKSLHISFDENVNPYMTLDVHQMPTELIAKQIDEICLEDPRNTLGETMKEFKSRYPNNGTTIFIYGDATSKKADVKLEKGKNFYTLIENSLEADGYTVVRRVPKSNPNPEIRGNWLNKVFEENLDGIEVIIGDKCVKTISDYNYLKQASDGSKHKEKARHPITKVTYEKYGHNTDANDYFYTYVFANSFDKFRKPTGTGERTTRKRRLKKNY